MDWSINYVECSMPQLQVKRKSNCDQNSKKKNYRMCRLHVQNYKKECNSFYCETWNEVH